jgi:hypothetical protein
MKRISKNKLLFLRRSQFQSRSKYLPALLAASIVLACLISGMSTRAMGAPFSTTASTVIAQETFFYGTYGGGEVFRVKSRFDR